MSINKKKLKKLMIVAALGVIYYIFISLTPYSLKCPVYTITRHHIKCPGCGITRACIALSKLDLSGAFYYHSVALIFAPLWAVCGALWLFDRGKKFVDVVSNISLAILLIFFVVRNIPGFPLY